MFAVLVVRRCN